MIRQYKTIERYIEAVKWTGNNIDEIQYYVQNKDLFYKENKIRVYDEKETLAIPLKNSEYGELELLEIGKYLVYGDFGLSVMSEDFLQKNYSMLCN